MVKDLACRAAENCQAGGLTLEIGHLRAELEKVCLAEISGVGTIKVQGRHPNPT